MSNEWRDDDKRLSCGGSVTGETNLVLRICRDKSEVDEEVVDGHEGGFVALEGDIEVKEAVASALELDEAASDQLGEAGFDPVYGARPLKRAIQHQLENPLAQRILRGEFAAGDTIRVTARDGVLAFERAAVPV